MRIRKPIRDFNVGDKVYLNEHDAEHYVVVRLGKDKHLLDKDYRINIVIDDSNEYVWEEIPSITLRDIKKGQKFRFVKDVKKDLRYTYLMTNINSVVCIDGDDIHQIGLVTHLCDRMLNEAVLVN